MGSFTDFLVPRMALARLLKEHSEYLDPKAVDGLFHAEAEKRLPTVANPEVREDLLGFLRMRPIAYMDKVLRRAGVPEADLDEAIQTLVVKFLYSPGSLFGRWDVRYPFTPRFKLSVKNGAISIGQKRQRRAKRFQQLPADPVAKKPGLADDPIRDFRDWIETEYGEPVARVLDQRLADRDTKELIGQPGLETAYAVKQAVQKIKAGAIRWSHSHPDFLLRVHRLMEREAETMRRRFGGKELVGAG
jgi:hypothetical protein